MKTISSDILFIIKLIKDNSGVYVPERIIFKCEYVHSMILDFIEYLFILRSKNIVYIRNAQKNYVTRIQRNYNKMLSQETLNLWIVCVLDNHCLHLDCGVSSVYLLSGPLFKDYCLFLVLVQ